VRWWRERKDWERARREAAEIVAEVIRDQIGPTHLREELPKEHKFYVDGCRMLIELRHLHDLLHHRADKGKRFRF
jgi:hypothetical protein